MKSLERKLIVGIVVVSVLLTIAGAVLYSALNDSNTKAAQVEHSNEVLTELEATLSILKDGETGQRGYIITGEEEFLEPYRSADQHAGENMVRLKKLTENNAFHREKIAAAEPLIEAKFALMRRTIELRRNVGFEAAQSVIASKEGKRTMDAIRVLFAAMENEEINVLNDYKVASEAKERNVIIAFAALFLLIFSLFCLIYILVKRDIDERNRFAVELQTMATVDELTGVFNRREANRLLEQEFSRSRRYGSRMTIMMLDIDHFKSVNDTHGHQVGDEVLKWFAEKMRSCIRKVDLPTRFGGEEFLVILPETDEAGALVIAERTRLKIAESPFIHRRENDQDLEISITVSIGVSGLDAADTDTELVKSADDSLYQAKSCGRNRVVLANAKSLNYKQSLSPTCA